MGIFLGSTPVSVYFNGTAAQVAGVYLGSVQVYPTGAATTPASLLLNFNGENNSTTFTDSSASGLTVTANGDAKISTAQSKFGGASGLFDGSGDYVQVAANAALDFGTGDFTVEFWARLDAVSGTQVLLSRWDNNGDNVWQFFAVDDALTLEAPDTGGLAAGTLSAATWHHIALTREGSTVRSFLDGQQQASVTNTASWDSTSNLVIGANDIGDSGANWYAGYIDDLRIVKGKAVYTANFTPPTAQLGPNA